MSAIYDFETCPDRQGWGSLKWDRYSGKDILPMWVADMDFQSAPEILAGLGERLQHGVFGYTVPYSSVTEATLTYLERAHHYRANAEWITWLPGLVPALNLCCHAFTETDQSVLTLTPVYPPFRTAPSNAGRKLIEVPLFHTDADRWEIDFDALEAAVQPHTRLFFLCSPHNPVGKVFSRDELIRIATFCERHDLILVSDEIHCDLIFDPGARHCLTATLSPEVAARTVTLLSPSKTYNLPGLACAYAVMEDPGLRQRFERTIRGIITEVNCFGYAGCEAAYRRGEPWRAALLKVLHRNYELVYETIRERLPGIHLTPMEASYLAWLDIRELELKEPAAFFERAGVGLSDGAPFGDPHFLRLNFGCPTARLEEGLNRMAAALTNLS